MTFIFVHIPKTAGTSFRLGLERRYPGRMLYDYNDTGIASDFIYQDIYESQDPERLRIERIAEEVKRRAPLALCGHFPAGRYWGHFPPEAFVTFLRDPVERAISNYDHLMAFMDKEVRFEDFLNGSGRDFQTNYLKDCDPDAFGMIGITESYRESLRLLARRTGLEVPHLRRNRTRSFQRLFDRKRPPIKRTPRVKAMVAEANREDAALYQELRAMFRARYKEAFGRPPDER